jgi:hypothetical protein
LQKEKASRLRDIGDARLEIEEALREEPSGVTSGAGTRSELPVRRLSTYALVFLLGSLVGAAAMRLTGRPKAATGPAARFNINLPAESRLRNTLGGVLPIALSADATLTLASGRTVATRSSYGGSIASPPRPCPERKTP